MLTKLKLGNSPHEPVLDQVRGSLVDQVLDNIEQAISNRVVWQVLELLWWDLEVRYDI